MTDCSKIPTLTDIEESKSAMDDIQLFTYSAADSFIDSKGVTRDTITGRIKKMGFTVPIAYAAGISFATNDEVKTVEENGTKYGPKSSALPFTTSGTFIGDDDARFFVVQGVTDDQLLSDTSQSYESETLSAAINLSILVVGKVLYIKDQPVGKVWDVVLASGVTVDDIRVFASVGVPTLALVQRVTKKSIISFMFDDATRDHFDEMLPLFEARGFPLAFAVCPRFTGDLDSVVTRLSTTELLECQSRGVEIVNHSMSHRNMTSETSAGTAKAEIETARQWLEKGGLNVTGYVAANSTLNAPLVDATKGYSGYACTVYSDNDANIAVITDQSDAYRLSRFSMDGVSSANTIENIKETIRRGGSSIFYDHIVTGGSYTNLVAVLDYLATISDYVDVRLPRELVDYEVGKDQINSHKVTGQTVWSETSGWSVSGSLGLTFDSADITLTPTTGADGTLTIIVPVEPNTLYNFNCNLRTGSGFAALLNMGVQQFDGGGGGIAGGDHEGDNLTWDDNFLRRYSVNFKTSATTATVKLLFRVAPSTFSGQSLLIRQPSISTGVNILKTEVPGEVPSEVFVTSSYTPVSTGELSYHPLRVNAPIIAIANPTGVKVHVKSRLRIILQTNYSSPVINWGSEFKLNPNTAFTPSASSDNMIVDFMWYGTRWIQEADTAWISQ